MCHHVDKLRTFGAIAVLLAIVPSDVEVVCQSPLIVTPLNPFVRDSLEVSGSNSDSTSEIRIP